MESLTYIATASIVSSSLCIERGAGMAGLGEGMVA